ncbi:MAG: hypothetical protein R6U43_04260 [Candidatus Krumholzibacteriales bacterium]
MKCSKAKEYYFSNRDGLLNESERMELQKHMEGCADCASFREEMDQSLSLLEQIPSPEVSDSFVWNVKRKISRKKVDIIRKEHHYLEGQGWMTRFMAGAAAALIILAAGAWLYIGEGPDQAGIRVAESDNTSGSELTRAKSDYREMEFTSTGYPAGMKMVNDDIYQAGAGRSFEMQAQYRFNYLARQNQLLRRQLIAYRNENERLRKLLLRYSDNK